MADSTVCVFVCVCHTSISYNYPSLIETKNRKEQERTHTGTDSTS